MAENKTKVTEARVESYLSTIEDKARRKDCEALAKLMTRATKQPPKMWGTSIVGFGSYHYKYESGRKGDSCLTGFSSRKGDISIYLVANFPGKRNLSASWGSTSGARAAYTFAGSTMLISKSLSSLSSAPSQRGSGIMAKANLVVTRVFAAPVEQVWKAWSDPAYVMQWWGPQGFTCPSAKMDFCEGGTTLVCMRAPQEFGGQDMYNTWTYKKIVPLQRIEYILNFTDKGGRKIDPVTIGLSPDLRQEMRHLVTFKVVSDNKTETTITEYDWTVGQMMETSKQGLEQCLDKMAAIFANPQYEERNRIQSAGRL